MSLESSLEIHPRRLTKWLDKNYTNKHTRYNFQQSIKNWLKCVYGSDSLTDYKYGRLDLDREIMERNAEERIKEIDEGLERYFSELDDRDFTDDFKKFIHWMLNEEYSPLSIRSMCSKSKVFFARQKDPRCKIDEDDWANMKMTLIPKTTRASTQDDILTREELKIVLENLSIHGKDLALFLLSTGVRVGAACQLQMEDINLDLDPPEVIIRTKYTKGNVGGRVMWMSYEARDAIKLWHKTRLVKNKRGSFEKFDKKLVFNLNKNIFSKMWNLALKKADRGQVSAILSKRDSSTKNRIHVYHVHTLRKFFRTNMGLAGATDMVVHAWMGHKPYLNEYDRLGRKRMSEIYKEHMYAVTVYDAELKSRSEIKKLTEDSEKQERQIMRTEERERAHLDMRLEQMDAFAGMSYEKRESMTITEKWAIYDNLTKRKADAA